jgi:putative ABC transport system substrate-binding protein
MNRRDAVCALLAVAALSGRRHARAQAIKAKPFRIATLPDFHPALRDLLPNAMRELGWTEGHEFLVIQSGLQFVGSDIDERARRVVADRPDLILTATTAIALAAHRATATIPIVMISSGYPVEVGLADSLARPGKNVTGNCIYAGLEVWSKLLQLLRETKPDTKRVGILWTYAPPAFPREEVEPCFVELKNAERLLGLKLHIVEAAGPEQVASALAQIDTERPDALLVTSGIAVELRSAVMEFAVKRRLPTITDAVWVVKIEPYHPLLGYGSRFTDLTRMAVHYVDKILKGASPGSLPIQQPAKLELIVNLKTATAIGLTVPASLLVRADEVIE